MDIGRGEAVMIVITIIREAAHIKDIMMGCVIFGYEGNEEDIVQVNGNGIRITYSIGNQIRISLCDERALGRWRHVVTPNISDYVAKDVHVAILPVDPLLRISIPIILRAPDAVLNHIHSQFVIGCVTVSGIIHLHRDVCAP